MSVQELGARQHQAPLESERHANRRTAFAAFAVALVFVLIMAGVNLPNPIMPIYAKEFGIGPGGQGLLFSSYMGVLLVVLATLGSWPKLTASLVPLLIGGAGCAIAADIAMSLGAVGFPWLFVGRGFAGIAVGLATGATSAVILSLRGESARAFVGSGVVIGALSGNLGGAALAELARNSVVAPFLIHAALCGAATIAMVIGLRSARIGSGSTSVASPHNRLNIPRNRLRFSGYVLAGISWLAMSAVMALTPAQIAAMENGGTLLLDIAPAGTMLVTSFLTQRATARRIRRFSPTIVLVPIVVGYAGLAWALAAHNTWVLLVSCAIAGLGQGTSYNVGILIVTRGLNPAQQAVMASRYAAVAYSAAAGGVLAAGVAIASVGAGLGFLAVTVSFIAFGAIVSVLFFRRRRVESSGGDASAAAEAHR